MNTNKRKELKPPTTVITPSSSSSSNLYVQKLVVLAQKSSFDGVPQIVNSKSYVVKLVWIACLILSSYACGKTVVTNLIDYFSYSVDTVMELDRDGRVNFPTVTICRLQICGLDSQEYTQFVNEYFERQNQTNNELLTKPDIANMLKSFKEYFLKNYNKTELNSILSNPNASYQLHSDLIACLYDGLACTADDFAYFRLDEFHECYSFNSDRNAAGHAVDLRMVRRFGKSYGLHVELYLGEPEQCKSPLSTNYGLVVYVHNATYSVWSPRDNGFEVMSGYETDVAVDRTRLVKLPQPYSDCVVNTDAQQSKRSQSAADTFRVAASYTQQTCLQMCYQNILATRYKCYDTGLPIINRNNLQPCDLVLDSMSNLTYYDQANFYQEENIKCMSECPLECDSYTYKATLSNTEFPSLSYAQLIAMKKNITVELADPKNNIVGDEKNLWRNGFVSVNVFYWSELITTITERPTTELEAFISGLGGTLGLFLGISFLSFAELVEILLELIIIKEETVMRRRNKVGIVELEKVKETDA